MVLFVELQASTINFWLMNVPISIKTRFQKLIIDDENVYDLKSSASGAFVRFKLLIARFEFFYFRLVAAACLNFRRDLASKIRFACRLRNDLLGTSASSSEPAPTHETKSQIES